MLVSEKQNEREEAINAVRMLKKCKAAGVKV